MSCWMLKTDASFSSNRLLSLLAPGLHEGRRVDHVMPAMQIASNGYAFVLLQAHVQPTS